VMKPPLPMPEPVPPVFTIDPVPTEDV
jgi:hypothetical protein